MKHRLVNILEVVNIVQRHGQFAMSLLWIVSRSLGADSTSDASDDAQVPYI